MDQFISDSDAILIFQYESFKAYKEEVTISKF